MQRALVSQMLYLKFGWDLLFVCVLGSIFCACGSRFPKTLPSSGELGSPLGYRIARTISHLHTPYSYDACDSKGIVNGVFNEACYQDLRSALCQNRIDFALTSDHSSNMSSQTFSDLALLRSGDTPITVGPNTVGSQMSCSSPSDARPQLLVGYEGPLLALMMTQHEPSAYDALSGAARATFQSSDSLVLFPHTENANYDTSVFTSVSPNGFEVYNLHANLDPKIRASSLGLDAFGSVLDLLSYWIDPYGELEPDLALLSVLEWSSVYVTKWNQILQANPANRPVITAGSDAHQNVLNSTLRDGERVDSYRRLLRWFSNHVLVNSLSRTELKSALLAGRSWIVFEGLGIPVGMNYWVVVNGASSPVGSVVTYASGQTRLRVSLPTLHSTSPSDGKTPRVSIRLKKSTSGGNDVVVATSENADLDFAVTETGIYRVEIGILPFHLWTYLGYQARNLMKEYPWIITHPIYIQ